VTLSQRAAKIGGHLGASYMHSHLQGELPGLPGGCAKCLGLLHTASAPLQIPMALLPWAAHTRSAALQEQSQLAIRAES